MAPSFFKILLDPSSPHLSLPPDFITMQLKNKIPNNPIIKSANGGYCWRLKIKQIGESYCFVNGWNNVVDDINLVFGDFLFFKLVDQCTFVMSIYTPNGCEKILTPKIYHLCGDDPFFSTIIKKSHSNILRFPGGFAESVGIKGEGTMRMKSCDGKECVMSLKFDKSYRTTIRYYLSCGWPRFRRENGLLEGDECVFKFIRSEGKLLLAKVTKNKLPFDEVPATKVGKRVRGGSGYEHGGDVNVAHHVDELVKRSFEMPRKRLRGQSCHKKWGVLYF
ncbi:hypothetical protein QVD17_21158 [Tagetes erecta]|uniref:TF-B3 domain-containing protein n=1 Tax=Tagetes erecta TaxID=13708 RepID=A0AAD8KQH1_TARER|nr:hypothetical protein QVD17_21158 [Tagetes erecta]